MKATNNKEVVPFSKYIYHETLFSKKSINIDMLFCHNGHNLVSDNADIYGIKGIVLKATHNNESGFMILSPKFGDYSRTYLGLNVKEGVIQLLHL